MKSSHSNEKITITNNDFDMLNPSNLIGKDGKFHYLYKIVNLVNNKYYYGIHSTQDLNDNYKGSGLSLNYAYKKYGLENFIKYYIEFFDDRKSLLQREKEIVNEKCLEDDKCYNLTLGGVGQKHLPNPKKGRIHINNGLVNKLIFPNELSKFINNGWNIGQLQCSTKGKIVVHRNNEELYIYEEELKDYVENGWIRGGKTRNRGQMSFAKGLIWVNDGQICKRVSETELDRYLKDGWRQGSIQKFTKGYIRITNGFEDKNIPPDDEVLIKYYLSNGWWLGTHVDHSGRNWVYKDDDVINIKNDDLQTYIDSGWKVGRPNINISTNTGKVAVNKNKQIKYIDKKELQEYLNNGWVKGNPFNVGNCHEKGKIRINNGMISKNINPEELQIYLNDGWVKGSLFKKNMKGRIRINNGVEERMITEEDYKTNYDKSIWKRGLIKSRKQKSN